MTVSKEELGLPWGKCEVLRDGLVSEPGDDIAFFHADAQEEFDFVINACNNHHALVEALKAVTALWCDLVNSGDAGNWNPEEDEPIMLARKALKEATK